MNIIINKKSSKSLISQILSQLKSDIHSGKLTANFKLPSSRNLANELNVSRNVILEVYDQLLAEGYIYTKTGDGSYISGNLVYKESNYKTEIEPKRRGFKPFNSKIVDFRSGLADLSLFPKNKWLKLTKDVFNEANPETFSYRQPEGEYELRDAICNYIKIFRGVKCHRDQIIITAGTTQAIGLISQLIINKNNNNVVLEDPVTVDIQTILKNSGANILPVPVDKNGLKTELLKHLNPALIFVTPSHHFPLGSTLSMGRRVELLNYSEKLDTYIVEDDYDSEFRYDVQPTPSLQGLNPNKVIYMGTFSKTICPALRLGYVVLPSRLIDMGREVKWNNDLHNPVIDQLVLAKFIKGGHFNLLTSKMKKSQKQKRSILLKELKLHFDNNIEILGSATGLHISIKFKGIEFSDILLRQIEDRGVMVYPVEEHAIIKGKFKDTIILGYGFLKCEEIRRGLMILASVLAPLL